MAGEGSDEMEFLMEKIKNTKEHYHKKDLFSKDEIERVNWGLLQIYKNMLSQIEKNKLQEPMDICEDINCDRQ